MNHRGGGPAGERPSARKELVRDDAKRPHVRACIDVRIDALFGRHVGEGAERRPGGGQRRLCRGIGLAVRGETEVENLGDAFARDQDVARFEIAVHDPGGVGAREPVGHLRQDADGLVERHPPA